MSKDKLYTAEEMRQILNLKTVQTVYRMGARGDIPRVKIGTTVRFEMPRKGQNNESRR